MNLEIPEQIRYLRDNQKLLFRQIGEMLGLHRKTVSKAYSKHLNNITKKKRSLKLEAYQGLIAGWFRDCSSLKSKQVWERLKERGLIVDEKTVSQFTKNFRKKRSKVHYPLEFLPGEEAQVDWFFDKHPTLGKVCGFVMILSYSRFAFLYFFPRHSFEFFIEGHLKAFTFLGGIPRRLRYDNLRSVVLKRTPLTYNPSFQSFARAHDFEIYLCNVASGNEKGRVERLIRSIRDTCMNTLTSCSTFKALNLGALEWLKNRNNALHRTTRRTPADMLLEEKLRPIPEERWLNEYVLPPKRMSKTGLIIFDGNYYSAPDYLKNEPLIVHASPEYVHIYDHKEKKASHPRSFKSNEMIINPSHRSFKQISIKAKRERIYIYIKNLNPLMKTFLEESQKCGEDPYNNAYHIFKILPGHARETVLSAIRQALSNKQYTINSIYKKLKRVPDSDLVQPKNSSLLDIDYKARPLEEYQ